VDLDDEAVADRFRAEMTQRRMTAPATRDFSQLIVYWVLLCLQTIATPSMECDLTANIGVSALPIPGRS